MWTSWERGSLNARMLRSVGAASCFAAFAVPALAMVGGAPPASGEVGEHVVLIVGSRGTSCTATLIALLLTAAHCALPGATYKLVVFDAAHRPTLRDIARVEQHPKFDLNSLLAHRATADVALMRLAEPLPETFEPAPLGESRSIAAGDAFVVAGYGVTTRGDGRTGGILRTARLVATGKPGSLQLRLAVGRRDRASRRAVAA